MSDNGDGMIERFLSPADANRMRATLRKLSRHDISSWALTGGIATEIHAVLRGHTSGIRALNDLDFVVDNFTCIPTTIAHDFLFSHVHPADSPGKIVLQFVDVDSALRVDVFLAFGSIMSRADNLCLESARMRIVSPEDLVARSARHVLELGEGIAVASKYVHNYLRMVELADPPSVEVAWRDHRKPSHPQTFRETRTILETLIPAHRGLLVDPEYSRDTAAVCPRCKPTSSFPLADPNEILSVLGYC